MFALAVVVVVAVAAVVVATRLVLASFRGHGGKLNFVRVGQKVVVERICDTRTLRVRVRGSSFSRKAITTTGFRFVFSFRCELTSSGTSFVAVLRLTFALPRQVPRPVLLF